MNFNVRNIISPIINIKWQGFESTTLKLQQNGWKLASEELREYNTLRIIAQHDQMKLILISDMMSYNTIRYSYDKCPNNINIINIITNNTTIYMTPDNFINFTPFDAVPKFIDHNIMGYDDIKIFDTNEITKHDLIVDPIDVNRMMDDILKYQKPIQSELRNKNRKNNNMPETMFHGKILSFKTA